jgi:hypothetical protein
MLAAGHLLQNAFARKFCCMAAIVAIEHLAKQGRKRNTASPSTTWLLIVLLQTLQAGHAHTAQQMSSSMCCTVQQPRMAIMYCCLYLIAGDNFNGQHSSLHSR